RCTGYVETRCLRKGEVRRREFSPVGNLASVYGGGSPPAHWDVFVGAAPRSRKEETKDAIEEVWAAWVDIDLPDAEKRLNEFEPKPGIVVSTGTTGHRHAYWPLSEATDPET